MEGLSVGETVNSQEIDVVSDPGCDRANEVPDKISTLRAYNGAVREERTD